MAAKLAILSLCIACALGQALGLAVNPRSASPDETRLTDQEANGGQTRSLYSQNRITPHRMMHFGKRPVVSYPPAGLLELNAGQPPRQRSQRSVGKAPGRFPYTLYFDLAPNRVLEPVFDDGLINQNRREQHLAELIETVLEENRRKDYGQQKQKRLNQQPLSDWIGAGANSQPKQESFYTNEPAAYKMMRLIDAGGDQAFDLLQPATLFNIQGTSGAANNKDKMQSSKLVDGESSSSSSGNANDNNDKQPQAGVEVEAGAKQQTGEPAASTGSGGGEQQQQQLQQQDDANINVVGRSGVPMQMAQGDDLLSKYMHAQVVNKLLFGRPIAVEQTGGSYRNLGNFIKKAEPQRMTFMHFG